MAIVKRVINENRYLFSFFMSFILNFSLVLVLFFYPKEKLLEKKEKSFSLQLAIFSQAISTTIVEKKETVQKPHVQMKKETVQKPHVEAKKEAAQKPHVEAKKEAAQKPHVQTKKEAIQKPHVEAKKTTDIKPHVEAKKTTDIKPHVLTKKETVQKPHVQIPAQALEKRSEEAPLQSYSSNKNSLEKLRQQQKKEMEQNNFLSNLRQKIDANKTYPPTAQRRGVEGDVHLRFTILANGAVKNIEVVSGKSIFYNAAKDAIEKSFPIEVDPSLFEFPKELQITLAYKLLS